MAGSAVIGALRVDLSIDTAEFRSGVENVRKTMAGLGKSMQSIGKNLSLAVTAPMAAMGAGILKTAGDFEASMNRVGAATGANVDQMKAMQKQALDLGANTSKSASESADAMEMLAKNGLAVQDILGGAAKAAINLSEATGGELSSAADVTTSVMQAFQVKTSDLGKVVDQITGVTLQSKFGFDDYAQAMSQGGGVAGAFGVSLDDFNAVIAQTSSLFSSGSDAGTSFKTFLSSLVPKSKQAADEMERLGLQFFNADGSMKGMAAIAQELQTKLKGLSDQDLNSSMQTIFGSDGVRTAISLYRGGGQAIDELKAKIADTSAVEQSSARMKGFNGEMERLSGAFETLAINIANSGLLSAITQMVQSVGDFVSKLSETSPALLKWGSIAAGVFAAGGPVLIGIGLFTQGLGTIAPALALVGRAITTLIASTGPVGLLILAVGAAYEIWQNWDTIGPILEGAFDRVKQAFSGVASYVGGVAGQIFDYFAAIPGKMLEIGGQIIDGLWQGIKAKWETVRAGVAGIGTSISDSVKSALGIHSPSRVMHDVGVNIMQGLSNGMTSSQGQVLSVAGDTASGIRDTFGGLNGVGSDLGKGMESAFSGIGSSIADAIKGTKDWRDVALDAIRSVASNLLSSIGSTIGGGAGGLGGIFTGLLGGLFGFANGGSFGVGGSGGIDSQLVAFKASPNETVSVTKPGQNSGGASFVFTTSIDASGADPAALARVREELSEMRRTLPKQVAGIMHVRNTRGTRP